MVRTKSIGAMALFALFSASLAAPLAANADTQSNKNTWRNLGIGSAAVAGYGLLNHNSGLALLGAAGAAYSANRYEQDRHHQSQARRRWEDSHRYYHRKHYHH